jgi:LuxR family maltose regulon positive regulatory protein
MAGVTALPLGRRKRKRAEATERAGLSSAGVLVEGKTHVPEPRPEWIDRSSLVRRLVDGRDARLVVVSAPPGYGKTTLIAEWAASPAEVRSFAWVGLEEADNDPISLWSAIVAALDRTITGLEGDRLLRPLRDQNSDVEGLLLPHLLNELAARHEPLIIVLEDYHLLREPACHQQIEAFVDHLPPVVQIVLNTRTSPALPLARYRASGDVIELQMGDLSFTHDEAARLVRGVAGIRLSESDLEDLVKPTEGWPAAIYLAALSLRESADPAEFVRGFAGTNRLVVDYLSQEVLRPLPDEVRRFLLRTSVLDQFTGHLCDAIVGINGSVGTSKPADLLDYLERSNFLLIPLDDNRCWYRYHHLFKDVLNAELARAEPDLIPMLHRRAARWFDDHAMVGEAIGHALAGDDVDYAAALFTRHWAQYVDVGRLATVRGWMESIGASRVSGEPATAICAAWIMALSGDRRAIRHWLDIAQSLPHDGRLPDGSPSVQFAAALIGALFGFDGVPEMLWDAETAVALETEPTSRWYSPAQFALGYGRYLAGDPEGAIVPLEEAAQSEAAMQTFRILALSILSLSLEDLGRHSQAAQFARTACELREQSGLTETAMVTPAATALGAVLAREGRYEEARRMLEHTLDIRRRIIGLSPWPTMNSLVVLAEMALDSGDRSGARTLLDEAKDLVAGGMDSGDHLRAVLASIEQRATGTPRRTPAGEPLTERERAVLRLMRGHLSTREIGQELYVSVNTVKSHTRAIYRKLGVSSREEALRRAGELDLL